MLSVEKYEKIMSYWQEIQKSDLVNRVNRGIIYGKQNIMIWLVQAVILSLYLK